MRGPRRRDCFLAAAAAALVAAAASQGQSRRTFLRAIGLPAIDRGVVADWSHVPGTRAAVARRRLVGAAAALDRTSASGTHYLAGRVIVKFRDGLSSAARVRALSGLRPGLVPHRPAYADFDIVPIDASEDVEAVCEALGRLPDVEYAQPAYRLHTRLVPDDPFYSELQWNLPLIGLERAWDIQPAAGSDITVAVLDTGAAYRNATVEFFASAWIDEQGVLYPPLGSLTIDFAAAPELGSEDRYVAPYDFIWDDTFPLDLDGHGTHVSGTIGQLTNNGMGGAGVAFGVKLMPVKVIDGQWDLIFGSPFVGTDDVVARGIRYAVDNGAKILNMSLGRTGEPAPVIEDALQYAVAQGAFVAIAGGNSFAEGNPTEVLAEIASRVPGVVSVAAVGPDKSHAPYSTSGTYIELAAPGGTAFGFGRNGFVWQQTYDFTLTDTFLLPPELYGPPRFDVLAFVGYVGTSQATPHVAGVAAMLMQQGITSPAAIEAALRRFAVDLGQPGRDDTFGFGLVEARNALRGLGLAR
jgi:serine protease